MIFSTIFVLINTPIDKKKLGKGKKLKVEVVRGRMANGGGGRSGVDVSIRADGINGIF